MIQETLALIRIGLFHPGLMRLAWQIKHSGKSFLTYPQFFSLANNYRVLIRRGMRNIQVAEFGVGRGGSAIFLSWLVNRYGGSLYLFDVFARIPAPSDADGEQAMERYQAILYREDEDYYGNIPDLLEIIREEIGKICPLAQVKFIQGKYEEVLPGISDRNAYLLVHIDCDWYESAKSVLSYLRTSLAPGAILQVDDYYYWKGANQATDEAGWLSQYPRKKVGGAAIIDTGSTTISESTLQ